MKIEITQATSLDLFEVTTGAGVFLMVAPMFVISSVYGIQREGIERAMRELNVIDYCEWFNNGIHANWPDRSLIVRYVDWKERQAKRIAEGRG